MSAGEEAIRKAARNVADSRVPPCQISELVWEDPDSNNALTSGCVDCGVSDFLLDFVGSVVSVWHTLASVQSLVVALLALGSPCFFFYYRDWNGDAVIFDMNWSLISIAVLFPLTMTVTEAFRRRESALTDLSILKADFMSIYYAHRDWSWGKPGDNRGLKLRPGHVDDTRETITELVTIISTLLRAPFTSRARHAFTSAGMRVHAHHEEQKAALELKVTAHFSRLSLLVEELKAAGMPGNEASRIRQYFQRAIATYEHLRAIKTYRTPVGIRTLARLYILLTPVVMGPYYGYLAGAGDEDGVGLPFAMFFSLLASMAMQGIFSVRLQVEDPFGTDSVIKSDRIDIDREFERTRWLLAGLSPVSPLPVAASGTGSSKSAVFNAVPDGASDGGIEGGSDAGSERKRAGSTSDVTHSTVV